MSETETTITADKKIVDAIVHGMQEKKATEVVVLDLTNIQNAIASYFVICSGNSDTQIEAIMDSVEEEVKKACKDTPWKREGLGNKEWVLLDYVTVVAHIFLKNKRPYYGLEELWGDATVNLIQDH